MVGGGGCCSGGNGGFGFERDDERLRFGSRWGYQCRGSHDFEATGIWI